ncbi:MAG: zinc ribbon domain-containing protein [Anaerolineales bacterium]
MDIGSVFILIAIMMLVAVYISQPFFEGEAAPPEEGSEHSHLLAERERLLGSIKELDFDYDLEKISESHYQKARRKLVMEAAQVLQKIDAVEKERGIGKTTPTEAEIRKSPPRTEVDEIETLIAARRRELGEKRHIFCPHCGHVVGSDDQYCVHCGEKISS